MPTVTLVIKDETDKRLRETIRRVFGDQHGTKKRIEEAGLNLIIDGLNGLDVREQFTKYVSDVNCWLSNKDSEPNKTEDDNKKALDEHEAIPEVVPEIISEIIPVVEKIEEVSPPIPRVEEQKVTEVIQQKEIPEAITKPETIKDTISYNDSSKPQPVQDAHKSFSEYDGLSYKELMEVQAKFKDFSCEEDYAKYHDLTMRMVALYKKQ